MSTKKATDAPRKPEPTREYLSGVDILFGALGNASARNYLAGGGISVFDPPFDESRLNPESIKRFLKDSRNYGRWIKKLYADGDPVHDSFWRTPYFSKEGFTFDIDKQFSVVDLAEPTEICFHETVSKIFSTPLDLENAAPWHCYYIRGLPNGSVGFVDRIQHALSDGEGHIRNSLTQAPEAVNTDKSENGDGAKTAQYRIRRASIVPQGAIDGVTKYLGLLWAYIVGLVLAFYYAVFVIPRKVSPQRRSLVFTDGRKHNIEKQCAWSSKQNLIDLAFVKDLKTKLNCSLNDVILAASYAAVETFLKEKGALRDQHLYFSLPTSFRKPTDNALANRLAYYSLLCPSSSKPMTRVQRAKQIARWMNSQKKMRSSAQAMITALNTFLRTPWLLPQSYAESVMAQSHGGISNIPGPASPLYFNGVPISRMAVLNPLPHAAPGQLGIAVISYVGKFSFGVAMEKDEDVPEFSSGSAERIVELFEQELKELAKEVKELSVGEVKKDK